MDFKVALSQKEGQEDQGTLKQLLRGAPLKALLPLPGPLGLPHGSGLPGSPSSYPNPSSYPYVEVWVAPKSAAGLLLTISKLVM